MSNAFDRIETAIRDLKAACDDLHADSKRSVALQAEYTDLERLIHEAVRVTARVASWRVPQLDLGHLEPAEFTALCHLLETEPHEVERHEHLTGEVYLVIRAKRMGVSFRAQRSGERDVVTVIAAEEANAS